MTLLPPLSPFGRVDTVLSKHVSSFPGPVRLQSTPSPVACSSIATFPNYQHRMCLRDWYGRLFTVRLLWGHSPLGP